MTKVYLLHGFRWPRKAIRIHTILQNLDDCSPDWITNKPSTTTLLQNFRSQWPETMQHLPNLRFVEQFDPATEDANAQPYAYVADVVHEVGLSISIDELTSQGIKNDPYLAMLELRDKLAAGSQVTWYVVVNGDEERSYDEFDGEEEDMDGSDDTETPVTKRTQQTAPPAPPVPLSSPPAALQIPAAAAIKDTENPTSPRNRLKSWFSKKSIKKTKSMTNLQRQGATSPPPVPAIPTSATRPQTAAPPAAPDS